MPFPSFGRSNRTRQPSHRAQHAQPSAEEAVPDQELESYLAALSPETAPETTDTGRRFGDAQVLQLRLNLIASDELKQLAQRYNTSPHSLAQEWILQRLSWEAQNDSDQRRHRYR